MNEDEQLERKRTRLNGRDAVMDDRRWIGRGSGMAMGRC
jgi:hypothetical protein